MKILRNKREFVNLYLDPCLKLDCGEGFCEKNDNDYVCHCNVDQIFDDINKTCQSAPGIT